MPLPPFAMHRCRVEHRNDACSRLSLPQTTTAAPPPMRYIGGRLSLALRHGLPVFSGLHAARRRRYRFPRNPSRALRYPEPKRGTLVDPLQSNMEKLCSIIYRCRQSVKTGSPARRSSLISWVLRAGGLISRRLNSGSFGLTVSSLNQAQHLGGQLRASLRLSGPALSPRESLLPQLRPKGSSAARTADGVTDHCQRTDRSLIAIHLKRHTVTIKISG